MEEVRPSFEQIARRFASLSTLAAGCVMAVGSLALLGWVLDMPVLLSGIGTVTIKTNTAIALVLAGTALLLLRPPERDRARTLAGRACAIGSISIGGLTLLQHLSGWDLGIDQLLFRGAPGADRKRVVE